MRAVTFDVTIPSYLVGKSLGKVTEAALFGRGPSRPGGQWVKLEIIKVGRTSAT